MQPGPSSFTITSSTWSMKPGSSYVILQSRMLSLTRTDLLFSTEGIQYILQSPAQYYIHTSPQIKVKIDPALLLCIPSIVHLSYRFNHLCRGALVYGGAHFSRLSKTETVI